MLWTKFEEKLNTADFVIGCRFGNIGEVPDQKISSNLFASILVYAVFGKKILDISCGYRAFSLSKFQKINNYSDSYGFLYDSLFNNIGSAKPIAIPCIYDYSELLATRTSELLGFLDGIKKFTANNKYNELVFGLIDATHKKIDLHFSILGFDISAFYLPSADSYIFQMNKEKIKGYYGQ